MRGLHPLNAPGNGIPPINGTVPGLLVGKVAGRRIWSDIYRQGTAGRRAQNRRSPRRRSRDDGASRQDHRRRGYGDYRREAEGSSHSRPRSTLVPRGRGVTVEIPMLSPPRLGGAPAVSIPSGGTVSHSAL